MNLQYLKNIITEINADQANYLLALYPIIDDHQQDIIRFADITKEAGDELKSMILVYLVDKFINNDQLQFVSISDADDRKNSAFFYDLEEKPIGLNVIDQVVAEAEQTQFSFSKDDFDKIKGFVVILNNGVRKIAFYKHHHHLSTLRADKTFGLVKSDHRFVKMDEDIIKLTGKIDFIQIEGNLIVTNLKGLESAFGYEDVIRKQATRNIDAIDAIGLLEDINQLIEMSQSFSNAKRIMKIKVDSPVLMLPVATVINFVQTHPPIMRKFRLSENGKLNLHTDVSKKLFLRLMNDDLLTSELTKLYYAGVAKDKMEADLVEEL